jgi:TonB family protein
METAVTSPADAELHLLTEWGDRNSRVRWREASIASVLVHIAGILVLMSLPPGFLDGPAARRAAPPIHHIVTPLIDPPTEFTQKTPNKGKIAKELDVAALQPRERIRAPQSPPSTTRPQASRPAPVPAVQPAPTLPEPPKLEAGNREAPKLDLPPAAAPPPPQIQTPQIQAVEKPKLALENVGGPPPPVPPGQSRIAVPNTSVSNAIREVARSGSAGGLMVGDPGAGSGGYGVGINLPPSPGVQGSALELKSDPMGVDFRPYLAQILQTIRRNWYAVMPQSVKLGRRGKVGLLFAITQSGSVSKVTWAGQSGVEALDRAAVAAISASNPFPPLPPEFKGERVVLQLNFAYNMPKQ